MISIISAIGKNNEIGRNNWLLWDLPADMKHFRETTKGKTVIMGQKTFESLGRSPTGEPIGKPLPNRRNIVATLDKSFNPSGVEISSDIHKTIKEFKQNSEEVFVIGGAQIYALTIADADKLYITHVEGSFPDADTFFPKIDPQIWKKIKSEKHEKDSKNQYDLEFAEYVRKN